MKGGRGEGQQGGRVAVRAGIEPECHIDEKDQSPR